MLLKQFIYYLEFEKRYSKHTVNSYKKDLEHFNTFLLETEGKVKLLQVKKIHLRNFIIYLSEKKLKPQSINRKISSLKKFYKYLVKQEKIKSSPLQTISNLKTQKNIQLPYSEVEMNKINKTFLENDFTIFQEQLIIEVLYQTGIRKAELIGIKINDINNTNLTLKVLGKRNKERLIPISLELNNWLNKFIELKKKDNISSPYLFSLKNGKKLYPKFVYKIVNLYLSHTTTKEKRSPHMLRHTFATHILNNGAEINSVKELLGHSSLASTQIYTHQDIETLKEVFKKNHPRETNK